LARIGRFDLIFCRNVLIYFDLATKRKVFEQIHGALSHRGYLLVGAAETTLNIDSNFQRIQEAQATFYQVR
jgi:chemotaxis protein methyltransferase CheR